MRRIHFIFLCIICAYLTPMKASNDLNAMDDIGFDDTFAYYSSANETINMQSGSVIVSVPVSPSYPGPEGSGLDLQLNMYYNSNSWRYRMNKEIDFYCGFIEYNAILDLQSMYYSSVGFGWSFHMGRLFRLSNVATQDCATYQFYFEDSSGNRHDFAPYCEPDQIGTDKQYFAQDGSGFVLDVKNFGIENEEQIVLYDGSGKKYRFGEGRMPPILPNHCDWRYGMTTPEPSDELDQVFYVEEISNYNNSGRIEINYGLNDQGENPLYFDHQISSIRQVFHDNPISENQFCREISFDYDSIVVGFTSFNYSMPRLISISVPGFDSSRIEYLFHHDNDLVDITEPWGQAECETNEGSMISGPLILNDQLFLRRIELPLDYNHEFSYNDFGEIEQYTNPLGAISKYHFKNVISTKRTDMDDQNCNVRTRHYLNPSRFLWRKTLDMGQADPPLYVWDYTILFNEGQSIVFDSSTVEISDASRYGDVRPITLMKDPDGNYTVYHWYSQKYFCRNAHSSHWHKSDPDPDCPDDVCYWNGRLSHVEYFEGEYNFQDLSNLRKKEIYTYTEGHPYGCRNCQDGLHCHENSRVVSGNIRQASIVTQEYFINNEESDFVSTGTRFDEYDDFGNVLKTTKIADGLPNIVAKNTYDQYVLFGTYQNSKYKDDFLTSSYSFYDLNGNGEFEVDQETLLSGSLFYFNESGNGRMNRRTDYIDQDYNSIDTVYQYSDSSDPNKVHDELIWIQIGDCPQTEFTYEYGTMDQKFEGGLLVEKYEIHDSTGLVQESYDMNNNKTSFSYDDLFRLIETDFPGERKTLTINYDSASNDVTKLIGGNPVSRSRMDMMGNVTNEWILSHTEEGGIYNFPEIKDSTFDWRRLEMISHYPGTSTRIQYHYDSLGRLTDVCDYNTTVSTEYSIDRNADYPRLKKQVSVGTHVDSFYYDLHGNLREVQTGAPAGLARYNYNGQGKLTEVFQGNEVSASRYFASDLLGRSLGSYEPETGLTLRMYRPDGKVEFVETEMGKFQYLYDSHNRLEQVKLITDSYPDGKIVRILNYDEQSVRMLDDSQVLIGNGAGRVTSIKNYQYIDNHLMGIVHSAFSFNENGNLINEWVCMNWKDPEFTTQTYSTDYQYDEWGSIQSIKQPVSQNYLFYSKEMEGLIGGTGPYTTSVQMWHVSDPDNIRMIAPDIYYNKTGGLRKIRYDNEARMLQENDDKGRFGVVGAWSPFNDIIYYGDVYTYDEENRIESIGNRSFFYYEDGSLMGALEEEEPVAYYTYDYRGNLTSRDSYQKPELSFVDRLFESNRPSNSGYIYDKNGNMTFNPELDQTYHFTPENRMVQADLSDSQSIRFLYDSKGKRRMKIAESNAEIYFYDLSGNSLLEKVTMDVTKPDKLMITDDECYINLGLQNIAKFNYFEPVLSINFLSELQSVFYPDQTIEGYVNYDYKGQPLEDIRLYILLEINGSYYYYPSWSTIQDYKTITIHPGDDIKIPFVLADLPVSMPECENIYFHAFMVSSEINQFTKQIGNLATREFSIKETQPDVYVNAEAIGGDGTLDYPFNSIEQAMNAYNPDSNRWTIKLFPGDHILPDGGLNIEGKSIDIIGSGQSTTFVYPFSDVDHISLSLEANVVLQGFTSLTEIESNKSDLFLRDIQFDLENESIAVNAENSSQVRMSNCLITAMEKGITLSDSSAWIKNCTLDVDDVPNQIDPEAVFCEKSENYPFPVELSIEDSIIANSIYAVVISGNVDYQIKRTTFFNNPFDFTGLESQIGINGNLEGNPLFISGRNHDYYLSCTGSGQTENSPCINTGNPGMYLENLIGGSTRTDGVFDICVTDRGYHGECFTEIIGIRNLNNDKFLEDDPKSMLNAKTSTTKTNSMTVQLGSVLATGPKDVLTLHTHPDGNKTLETYFNCDCSLEKQESQLSPDNVLDASIADFNEDGSIDVILLEEEGPNFYVNDTAGNLTSEITMSQSRSNQIESLDINDDGLEDLLIATNDSLILHQADQNLNFMEIQRLNIGQIVDMILFDFNGDGDRDLATLSSTNEIQFLENNELDGFRRIGDPISLSYPGRLKIKDSDNDGQMELIVDIARGIEQIIETKGLFGHQPLIPSGKRAVEFVLFDHLGTAKMLTDNRGLVTWPGPEKRVNELTPYGKDLDFDRENRDPDEAAYILTFTNKDIDHDLDLHYFGARYYNASQTTFISADPVGGKVENPLSWNRYLYCRNDPINYFDPNGEDFYYLMDKQTLFGAGHSAVLTGPVNGKYRYDSFGLSFFKNTRHGVYYFDSLDDAMAWIFEHGYDEYIRWETSEEEDKAAQAEADKWHKGNGDDYERLKSYDLFSWNCDYLINAMANVVPSVIIMDRAMNIPRWNFGDNRHMGIEYKDVFRYLSDKEIYAYKGE